MDTDTPANSLNTSATSLKNKTSARERIINGLFLLVVIAVLGEVRYGSGISVETREAANVSDGSADLGGAYSGTEDISSNGSAGGCSEPEEETSPDTSEAEAAYTGVVYAKTSENSDPQPGGEHCLIKVSDSSVTPFSLTAEGLAPGTDYSFRAFYKGRDYHPGDLKTFSTDPGAPPLDTTTARDVIGDSILASALQADGRTLLGGEFSFVGGKVHTNLVRLSPDGSVDGTYNAGVSGGWVAAIAAQSDGKAVVGGVFTQVNGVSAPTNLTRLDAGGVRDASFAATVGRGPVECLAIQGDGKILVGGKFGSLGGNARYGTFGRLNPDGSIDTSFNPGAATAGPNVNANDTVRSIATQADGKILIAGDFTKYNGIDRAGFARLNADGTLDSGFNPGVRPSALALLPDGKILVGAFFPGAAPAGFGLARYLADGTKDTGFASFDPAQIVRLNSPVRSLVLRHGGEIVIGGPTLVDGTATKGVAKVDADGFLDTLFSPEFDYLVSCLGSLSGGGLVIGGEEPALSGKKNLIGVVSTPSGSPILGVAGGDVEWTRDPSHAEVSGVTFDLSSNGGVTWTALGAPVKDSGIWKMTGATLPGSGLLRARGRTSEGQGNGSGGLVEQIEDFPTAGASAPGVVNPTVTGVGARTATLGGELNHLGTSTVTERGVVVSRTADSLNPFVGSSNAKKVVASGTGPGVFSVGVAGLVPGTHYTFKAFATSGSGTRYSPTAIFVTTGAPILSAPTVNEITQTGAILGGTIDSDGGSAITERGVLVAPVSVRAADRLASTSTASTRVVEGGTSTGAFSVAVTGLTSGVEYRCSAFATNTHGTSYSPWRAFNTEGAAPSEPEGSGISTVPGLYSLSSAPEENGEAGTLDDTFDPGTINGIVQVIAVQPDGSSLIAGEFGEVQGEVRSGIARLDRSGLLDFAFNASSTGVIYTLRILPDGRLLVGGFFRRVNGVQTQGLALLEPDGSLVSPTEFNTGGGVNGIVYATSIQDDGKIVLGGLFDSVQGVACGNLARLNADGSLDADFDPVADDAVYSLEVQSDGMILVGGNFKNVNAVTANHLARLEPDGDLDPAFDAGDGANGRIAGLALQPDGKILLCGVFSSYQGTTRNRIARVNTDGTLDPDFNPGSGADAPVYTMAIQTDGKILVGGDFQTMGGTARNRIARILATGALDSAFDPGTGADGEVSAIALQEDGGILIGGDFTNVDGEAHSHLARFENEAATESFTVLDGSTVEWFRGGTSPEILDAAFELSENGGLTWSEIGTATRRPSGWRYAGPKLPLAASVRALGETSGGFLGGSGGLVEGEAAFDHTAKVATLRAQSTASRTSLTKLKRQIKAAKKKRNKAKVRKLTKRLKTETTRLLNTQTELGKY